MKKIIIFSILIIFAYCLFSQEEDVLILKTPYSETQKEGKSKLPLENRMEMLWFVTLSHIKEQQFAQAEVDIKKIIDEANQWEIKKFSNFAIASLGLFYEALKKDEILQAQYLLKFATLFNPDIPELYIAKADFAWAQNSYFSYFFNIIKYLYKSLKGYNHSLSLINNLLIIFFISALIILMIFTLFLFYRNFSKIKHDLMELFEKKYNSISSIILSLSIILLPVIIGLSWFWIICYFCTVVFGYSKNSEKFILILLIILQTIAFPVIYYNLNTLYESFSPIIQSTYALQNKELSYKYVPEIEIISAFVEDPDLIFLLGNLYEASGDTLNSMAAYKKAIAKSPAHGLSYVGLGNQYFWQANYGAAITEYLNAQKFLPFFPPLYFNLSKSYNQNYQYNMGTEALNAGMAINSRQILKFISSKPSREIIPVYYKPEDAYKLVHSINKRGLLKGKGIRGHENTFDFKNSIFLPYTISFLLCLILTPIFHLYRRKNWEYAGICTKCGRSFCKKCKSASESQIYCTQCIHIYIKKDGVSIDTKVKKVNEVKRFLRQEHYLKKIFNLLIPGFAFLMEDKKFKGFITILIFSLILIYLLLPLPFYPYAFIPLSFSFIKKIVIVFLVILWFITNIRVLIEKGGV